MMRKPIRYASLGLLAVAIMGAVLIFTKPQNVGRLEFIGFRTELGEQRASFVYHPPQGLKGFNSATFWAVEPTKETEINSGWIRVDLYPEEATKFSYKVSERAVWRVMGRASVRAKGINILPRLRNIWNEKRLGAWNSPAFHELPPVYSCLITNPAPHTASQ